MTALASSPTALRGILFAIIGSAIYSINDLAMKALTDDYALHQIILIRAVVSLMFLLVIMAALRQPYGSLVTRRPLGHLLRVSFVVITNVTYFIGLAALPLGDAVAIAFVSPLLMTILSIVFLHEKVGPRRWAAVCVGLVGVMFMVRPGTGVFQPAALLVLMSALGYAATNMMTRVMRHTESAFSFGFYVHVGFIVVSICTGLVIGDGRFDTSDDPALAFLTRAWVWPDLADWPLLCLTGLSVTLGGLFVTQAYRLGEGAVIASFEYVALPLAIVWGFVFFRTVPDFYGWIGIALIAAAGLYTIRREARVR